MKERMRRWLCQHISRAPVVDSLPDRRTWPIHGVELLSELPIDLNAADYQNLPSFINRVDQCVAFDSGPSTPINRLFFSITNASIVGVEGIVLADGSFLLEPFGFRCTSESQPAYESILYSRGFCLILGPCFLVPLYWFHHYYHLISEILP